MFGKDVRFFSSTHERSHIAMALGMAPREDSPQKAVLVWEGYLGHIYLIGGNYEVMKRMTVLEQPGGALGVPVLARRRDVPGPRPQSRTSRTPAS